MTEKDYNPEQRNKKVMEKPGAVAKQKPVTSKTDKTADTLSNKKIAESQSDSGKKYAINTETAPKSEVKKTTPKGVPRETSKEVSTKGKQITKPKVKKNYAMVKGSGLPLSTKVCVAICKFIKGKQISQAIADLEQVVAKKKAVPMKGEIPHRKGKIMSGRFPKNAAEYFIKMLKNLQANANVNGLDEPVISEAVANIASQPYGRFGRVRRKRSHVVIRVREKKERKGGKK
jgi:ribosomal protein L22